MRILTLCYEYPPIGGGGGVVAAGVAREMVQAGHRVDLVTSRFGDEPLREQRDGVRIHRHGCRRRVSHYTTAAELITTLWPAYRAASALIGRARPDVIHVHFALPGGLVALALARRHRIPFVLTVHGSDVPGYNPDRFHWQHRLAMPLWRRIMAGAAVVTSPSQYLAGLVRSSVGVPVRVIPNGFAPTGARGTAKRKLVLVVSRLFPRKGVQHFLEAIRDLDTDWEFVVAGDGPCMPELRAQAARIRPSVRFVGFVGRDVLAGLYAQASILVFPSIKENCPMVLLEAMEAGCAVLTTEADGCAEVVGDAGVTVPVAAPQALRHALASLMADEDRRVSLAESARQRASLFGWPRVTALYLHALADAASPQARPEHAESMDQGRVRR